MDNQVSAGPCSPCTFYGTVRPRLVRLLVAPDTLALRLPLPPSSHGLSVRVFSSLSLRRTDTRHWMWCLPGKSRAISLQDVYLNYICEEQTFSE